MENNLKKASKVAEQAIKNLENETGETYCLLTTVSALVGGKWKLQLISHLSHGPVRFGQLKKLMHLCSEKMLIQALRELEEDALIVRKQYNEVPPRVEYSLSEQGQSLVPIILQMMSWGKGYLSQKHPACKVYIPNALLADVA
jgi:DNA-binding HxlR family transcriptional regulator